MSLVLELLDKEPFAVIGHRGASGYVLENTIPSFSKAIELGSDIVECDVHLSSDGVPVVIHDEDLSRLAGLNKKISDLKVSEIKSIDLNGYEVPTLDEVLSIISGKAGLFIEVKDPKAVDKIVNLIISEDAVEWVAIISFFDDVLKRVRELRGEIVTGLLYFKPPGRIFDAKKLGAKIVLPRYNIATKKANATAHRLRLKVSTWVINKIDLAEKMYKNGVDGMATDYPDKLVNFRNSLIENR